MLLFCEGCLRATCLICYDVYALLYLGVFNNKGDFSIWQQRIKGVLVQQKVSKVIDNAFFATVAEDRRKSLRNLLRPLLSCIYLILFYEKSVKMILLKKF